MLLAINTRIINKNELGDIKANAEGWENCDLTPKELATLIGKKGFAFCPQVKNGYRKSSNFQCSGYIAADIDEGLTLEEALENDFVNKYASILYTTASHTPDSHRFRIVFELETPITDPELMGWAMSGIGKKFNGDPSTKDACRMFYGSLGCEPTVFGHIIPDNKLNEIVELGKTARHLSDGSFLGDQKGVTVRSTLRLDVDDQVTDSHGKSHRVSDLPARTSIFCPFHLDKKPSAFIVKSKRGSSGVHCSSCNATFWADVPKDTYNFYRIDEAVKVLHAKQLHQPPELIEEEGIETWQTFFDLESEPSIIVVNDQFLPKVPISSGLTFIKSPKGSGKTQLLQSHIGRLKKEKKRILFVGHRQLLLQESAKRLGLDCYLIGNRASRSATKHYAISIDSLSNDDLINPYRHQYDVVIIDESEQVFAHFVSDTLKDKRRLAYFTLKYYLTHASIIVALDADLNAITMEAIDAMADAKDTRVVLNEYQKSDKPFDLYESEKHLLSDLFEAISRGERCFVSSNSKKFIDTVEESIKSRFDAKIKMMKFTSGNSTEEETIATLRNIKNTILDYQVTLASPTLGTGVDISFEDKIQHIDGVYGFFQANINTHFDIDQQLARVRDPRYVKVWISSQVSNFETEESVINNELIENKVLPELMQGYTSSGKALFNENDPFLNLYACVLAAQRASKNHLQENFLELKRRNGWTVNHITKDKEKAGEGSSIAKEGKMQRLQKLITELMSARILSIDEYEEKRKQERRKQVFSADERISLERAKIERFYNQSLTPELIEQDNEGRLRGQVLEFEQLFQSTSTKDSDKPSGRRPKIHEDRKKRSLLLEELLSSAGIIDQDRKPIFEHHVTTDNLKDFIQTCRKKKLTIERVLEMEVRSDLDKKPVTQIQGFLRHVGLQLSKSDTIRSRDGKTYFYSLDPIQWSTMMEISSGRHQRVFKEPEEEIEN